MTETSQNEQLFNSVFETGLRTLCALSAGHPDQYDIQQLLAFDHIIVHSEDMLDGPPSLHPEVQQRNGELLVRRPLIQMGLAQMETKRLVITHALNGQILYSATDLAFAFLDSLENPYLQHLRDRAEWAISTFGYLGPKSFFDVFNAAFDRWSTEFQISNVRLEGTEN